MFAEYFTFCAGPHAAEPPTNNTLGLKFSEALPDMLIGINNAKTVLGYF